MYVGCLIHRSEDEGFSIETTQWGNPNQAEHADGHADRQHGNLLGQPFVVIDLFGIGLIADQRNDRKRTQVHKEINTQVIQQAFHSSRTIFLVVPLEHQVGLNALQHQQCRNRHQHVTGMSDRRIGQHSFDVTL